jgi:hypothetical protein
MQRAGGKASIVSRRGEGTEIALELPRGAVDDAESGERP